LAFSWLGKIPPKTSVPVTLKLLPDEGKWRRRRTATPEPEPEPEPLPDPGEDTAAEPVAFPAAVEFDPEEGVGGGGAGGEVVVNW